MDHGSPGKDWECCTQKRVGAGENTNRGNACENHNSMTQTH